MKRVAVFGNTGAGKSTLAKALADITGLPLHALDKVQYAAGGGAIPHEAYLARHREIIATEAWIIEGYGCRASAWERFARADTLVYIDLPVAQHYWWVTKRMLKGAVVNPEGWPDNSPILSSTLSSYKVVRRCHIQLTPHYRRLVAEMADTKQVHHLRSSRDIAAFLTGLRL